MKYKGIIFDLDGVICFTDKLHYKAWKQTADKIGVDFDEEINNKLRGVSRMASLDIILQNSKKTYSGMEKEQIATYKNNIYRELLKGMNENDCSDEVRNTLKALRLRGIKLAVGSSSKNTPIILERLNIVNLFDAVSDGNNITHSKPDPEVFLKAAEFLNLSPNDCLVVEDAFAGIDAGIRGGFDTAAIGEAVKYDKPTYKLDTFSDLLKIK